jgi:hypothetical protein
MIWLYSCPLAIIENDYDQVIINLVIFSDTYQVYSFKNQTSNLIASVEQENESRHYNENLRISSVWLYTAGPQALFC